ncbi:hypothetical protein Q7P37_010159 [Cladosporium fusiforme]
MAPHGSTLPQALTESARAARMSFFCELCQKGYARMNEFQAHESSYDHSHRMRLKEMKQLTKDTGGGLRGNKSSTTNNEIQSISLAPANSGAPKKKPVFKAIGSSSNAAPAALPAALTGALDVNDPSTATEENDLSGAVRNGWYAERYEPDFISGCDEGCGACGGREGRIAI